MAFVYKNLGANAGSDWVTLGTVPAGKSWVFTGLSAVNKTYTSLSVSAKYLDSSSGGVDVTLANNASIATATTSSLMLGKLILNAGDVLQVNGGVNNYFGELTGNPHGVASATLIAYSGTRLLVMNASGVCSYSDDLGLNWSPNIDMATGTTNALTYGGGMFVTHNGTSFFTSADGVTWTARTSVTATFNDIVHNGTRFVAVGDAGVIYTSDDGITWTSRTSGTAANIASVAWSGTTFLAVGAPVTSQAISLTSTDGITWTANTANAGNVTLSNVVWVPGQSRFYAAVLGGSIFTTTDGISYTNTTLSTPASTGIATDGSSAVVSLTGTGGVIIPSSGQSLSARCVVNASFVKKNFVVASGKLRFINTSSLYSMTSFDVDGAQNISATASVIEVPA